MSFHLCAYSGNIANVANTDVPALSDDIMQIQNNHFIFPSNRQLLAAYLQAAHLSRGRLNSPTLRQIAPPYLRPLVVAAAPPTNPNFVDLTADPVTIRGQEEIIAELTGTSGSNEVATVLLWSTANPQQAPPGNVYTIRATSTTAAVAATWTTVSLTWDLQLPAGTYAVVGGEYVAANAIAFRLIFDQQYDRPGCLGQATIGLRGPPAQYNQDMGLWGQFQTITLPRAQVLNVATDAAHEFYLQCVKVS